MEQQLDFTRNENYFTILKIVLGQNQVDHFKLLFVIQINDVICYIISVKSFERSAGL